MNLMDYENNMRYCIELAKRGHDNGQYAIAALVTDRHGKILAASSSTLRKKK